MVYSSVLKLQVRFIVGKKQVRAPLLIERCPISPLGDIDPKTGILRNPKCRNYGKSISGKVFAYPVSCGSTVGSYVLYQLSKVGKAPLAIIVKQVDPVLLVGCILGNIELVECSHEDFWHVARDGYVVELNPEERTLTLIPQ